MWGAIGAVFGSWKNERAIIYRQRYSIPSEWGTAVNVQAMVFGNLGDDSATGVAFTRDPANGEKVIYGEYLVNAQGEDVVAGVRTPKQIAEMAQEMPESFRNCNACARSSSSISATCRISSSRSKIGGCSFCRRATANAPASRRSASRSR